MIETALYDEDLSSFARLLFETLNNLFSKLLFYQSFKTCNHSQWKYRKKQNQQIAYVNCLKILIMVQEVSYNIYRYSRIFTYRFISKRHIDIIYHIETQQTLTAREVANDKKKEQQRDQDRPAEMSFQTKAVDVRTIIHPADIINIESVANSPTKPFYRGLSEYIL